MTSPDGVSLSYSYDGSLPTQESWSGLVAGSVSLSYDANFRPASQRVNGGSTVAFGYDADGLLTSAGALGLTRDPANGLLTATTLGSVTTAQSYSGAGELASFAARYAGSPLFQTGYERDSLGRITAINETVQGVSARKEYRYDPAGRLSEVYENATRTALYEYDGNGNRTRFTGATPSDTASALYDDQDRMLRYGSARYSYTANGELTLKVEGADSTRYTYDELGNLITVMLPNHDRIGYVIDGQNRRVGKRLNGHLVKGWLYQNGLNPIAELDSTGAVVSRFVYGSRGHVPDYMVRGGVTYRLVTDHLGSVRLVTDAAAGAVAERLDYDAFGQVRLDTAPELQPFAFAGGLYEPATGLVRFGARDYDARTGRWALKDLIGASGLPNLFTYAEDRPIEFTDPAGTIVIADDAIIIGGIVISGAAISAYYVWLNSPEGKAFLASVNSKLKEMIASHLATAQEHGERCGGLQPEDPGRDFFRKEIRQILKEAEDLADRLPPKQRELALQLIRSTRGRLLK